MIPIAPQPEPKGFDQTVRKPGLEFLSKISKPLTSAEYKNRDYWTKFARQLHDAYSGVCAYSCCYMPTGGTVDHFLPKVPYSDQAYEWSNYRLSQGKLNQYKGNHCDVIDPFIIQLGWFVLEFPSCLVRPGECLSSEIRAQVERTITRLKLNDDDVLVQSRCEIMEDYTKGEVTLDFLERRYPFLATEITRQGLQDKTATYFKKRT